MSVSLPASAPFAPPDMPQSTYSRPVAAATAASLRVAWMRGREVDQDLLLVRPQESPCRRELRGSPSSRARRTGLPVAHRRHPAILAPPLRQFARVLQGLAVISQAAASRPARSRLRAMPRPIFPRPMTATSRGWRVIISHATPHRDICAGSQSASSGQKITIASTTNMIRWNGIVPYTTSLSLPSQMLWITNRLMPIGGEICPSSM